MPEQTHQPDTTSLADQYGQKLAADLELNEREQKRISTEAEALQALLVTLRADHALLQGMQETLAARVSTSAAVSASEQEVVISKDRTAVAVPRARHDVAKGGRTAKTERVGKTKAPRRATPAPKEAGTVQAPLHAVVTECLEKQSEPRSVSAITSSVAATHPEREVKPTLVRAALELLVSRGKAERTKQKRSVFYSQGQPTAAGEATENTAEVPGDVTVTP
ncbi:hypothetical protein [Streptomyces sp. ISL-11]|uniref:hypothetical protein n=1 Tax=Streptomyces sp. ISL-11 TaxID=2819174 RepID=UPI001BEC47BB|nr:hypothetical protein [Streptomyces sp. ISL-11]MBT2384972.1 hypothetical protein [Streptomyces sp. ISL-11]